MIFCLAASAATSRSARNTPRSARIPHVPLAGLATRGADLLHRCRDSNKPQTRQLLFLDL